MSWLEQVDALLHSNDRSHILQGIELLVSLGEPGLVARYTEGTSIDAHGVIHIGDAIRRFAPYRHGEAIAMRLLAAQKQLDTVETLELSDGLYMLPRLLPQLLGVRTLRCTNVRLPLDDTLLNALPPSLSVLDLTGVEELHQAAVVRLRDRLPPGCVVWVCAQVFPGEVPKFIVKRPFSLYVPWEGSGEDDETVTITFTRGGRFVRTHTEDTNHGMRGERYLGSYILDRDTMKVVLTLDGHQNFTTVRCLRTDCPAQPKLSFGGGHICPREPCENLGEGWTDPRPVDGTETLSLDYDETDGTLALRASSYACFWTITVG